MKEMILKLQGELDKVKKNGKSFAIAPPAETPTPDDRTLAKPIANGTTATSLPNKVIERVISRLENDPLLKTRVASGLAQELKGAALSQWLADGGFMNAKGEKYEGASLSHFKAAISYLTAKT